jgi:hypothetical protein
MLPGKLRLFYLSKITIRVFVVERFAFKGILGRCQPGQLFAPSISFVLIPPLLSNLPMLIERL